MTTDDRYTVETPEHIEVEFELAALGSRFCAILIDSVLMAGMIAGLAVVAALIGSSWLSSVRDGFGADGNALENLPIWLLALILSLVLLIPFGGYFIVFELVMQGQTPGKRAMNIRAIRDDATPMNVTDVLIRNLLRFVDFLPILYGVGVVVMFFHPMYKRLGDIAAGTVVIKEGELDYRANADRKYAIATPVQTIANRELEPEERRLLTGFLRRREELLPEARHKLAERMAAPLHQKYGGDFLSAESYLERLVEGRHHEP